MRLLDAIRDALPRVSFDSAHAETVLPSTAAPLDPAYPMRGCTLHGRYFWQRGCPGCPDPVVNAGTYERLDTYLEASRRSRT